ncbi:beta-lactamase-like protein [Mycena crocata]|nr:beta-lactamase-like protein [Mycena crocata]
MPSPSAPTFHALGVPASSATVSVRAFNISDDARKVVVPAGSFFQPIPAGNEIFGCPIFAFLVEHPGSGRKLMFDLGVRKDLENAAPRVAESVKAGHVVMPVSKDIVEQLAADGVDLASIGTVIWSHAHFDHVGDMSKFPPSTELVFGPDMIRDSYAVNPASSLLDSDLAGHNLVPVDFGTSPFKIGGFRANDFFGDGSFYVLDVPGHLAGHVCALARVTPDSFVFLGGDACHHAGMLRPTAALHRHVPCPGGLITAARTSISPTHFPPPDAEGRFDLAARATPLLDVAENGFYVDPPTARASIAALGAFDANADVFVALAHDETLVDTVGPFPANLNEWKAKGWKTSVTWAFVDEKNGAFRFAEKAIL